MSDQRLIDLALAVMEGRTEDAEALATTVLTEEAARLRAAETKAGTMAAAYEAAVAP